MVLGIVSFVIPFVGVITAPLAIVFGNKAKRQIKQEAGLAGSGMATAGQVLGWIGFGLVIFAIIAIIVVATNGHTTSSTFCFNSNGPC
jgi:predicted metal-binding membrane protein